MKYRIHVYIFFPVLLILIFFPFAVWGVFSMTSNWYVYHIAEKKTMEIMSQVEKKTEEIYNPQIAARTLISEKEEQYSEQLFNYITEYIENKNPEAKLIILNSKLEQTYPNGLERENTIDFYKLCKKMLKTNSFPAKTRTKLNLGEKQYFIYLFEVNSSCIIKAKYFIGYVPIPDTGLLLSYTGKLILLIVATFLMLASVSVWITAAKISKPLETFCKQTITIGNGTYGTICENYSVKEVEQLKESFNHMAKRLKSAEEHNVYFFQNVSHDLRTPLMSISGYAQGIQYGVIKDPKKAAEIILTESARMTNLVESLLTISKLDTHQMRLRQVRINVDIFLEEQLEILKGVSENKELILVESNKALYISADPDLLIRIFQNVISNCIQYAKSKVEIQLIKEDSMALILISDDGPGISEKDFPHIFEQFYHGEKGNFGIGLSLVSTGTQYMGGKVMVNNKNMPDQGAIYKLYFPLY